MFRTIQSRVTVKAHATVDSRPGLKASALTPVLCCPALALPAVIAAADIVSTSVQAVNGPEGQSNTECTEVAASFCTSALYVAPGRLSANHTPVADNASVDELIASARGDRTSA